MAHVVISCQEGLRIDARRLLSTYAETKRSLQSDRSAGSLSTRPSNSKNGASSCAFTSSWTRPRAQGAGRKMRENGRPRAVRWRRRRRDGSTLSTQSREPAITSVAIPGGCLTGPLAHQTTLISPTPHRFPGYRDPPCHCCDPVTSATKPFRNGSSSG